MGVESAQESRQGAREGEVEDAVVGRVDARGSGGVHVLADGLEGDADVGGDDPAADDVGNEHQQEDDVVVGQVGGAVEEPGGPEAQGAAGEPDHLGGEPQQCQPHEPRHDGGEDAPEAEGQKAGEKPQETRGDGAAEDADPGGEADIDGEDGRGVAAQAQNGVEAEVDDIDEAGGEIEGDGAGGDQGRADEPPDQVFLIERRDQRQNRKDRQAEGSGRRQVHLFEESVEWIHEAGFSFCY